MKCHSMKFLPILIGILAVFTVGCSQAPVSKVEIQRPSKLQIPARIQKIYIDPAQINSRSDKLGIKMLVLDALQNEINQQGRFQVTIGKPVGIDPNRKAIAVIRGDIISGEQVEDGQVTEIATCKGGASGIAGGITASKTSKQGVTRSRRGLICKAGDFKAEMVSAGVGTALSLLGVDQGVPPVDEVIRVFKYKNVSIFTQLNLSLIEIGKVRETLAIRSDNASFGRHIIEKADNVHESYLTMGEALPLLNVPVTPLYIRRLAVVDATKPGRRTRVLNYYEPKSSYIPQGERSEIIQQLVEKSIRPFVRVISPYKVQAEIEIAEAGDGDAVDYLKEGEWLKAREVLEGLSKKTPADYYNYGLTFEAGALSLEDYQEAQRLYLKALKKEPDNKIFAVGIGRLERRMKEAGQLAQQLK